MSTTNADTHHLIVRRVSTETESSYKATELIAYVVVAMAVLVAAAVTDNSDFGIQEAWFYVILLTIGYMVSRGLAKSSSRDFYDDTADAHTRRPRCTSAPSGRSWASSAPPALRPTPPWGFGQP
jgi:hypothetical protein